MSSFTPEWTAFQKTVSRLEAVLASTNNLAPASRKIVAELVVVRLAVAVENALSRASYKAVAGTSFLDGSAPVLLNRQRTAAKAEVFLKTEGGILGYERPIRWLDGSELGKALLVAFDTGDPFSKIGSKHGSTLAQLRRIRNHIAHSNRNSARGFQRVVKQIYGAKLNSMTPGTLLLTPRAGLIPLVEQLIIRARVMVKDMVRAP